MGKSKQRQRQSDVEFKGGIYEDDYDTEFGLSFDRTSTPKGPLHGEASSGVTIGKPRMPNRSLHKIDKGRGK